MIKVLQKVFIEFKMDTEGKLNFKVVILTNKYKVFLWNWEKLRYKHCSWISRKMPSYIIAKRVLHLQNKLEYKIIFIWHRCRSYEIDGVYSPNRTYRPKAHPTRLTLCHIISSSSALICIIWRVRMYIAIPSLLANVWESVSQQNTARWYNNSNLVSRWALRDNNEYNILM